MANGEWKGADVSDPTRSFDLIETMAFDPTEGTLNLERHLERMKDSAIALGFPFDRHDARNELQAATFRCRAPRKIRLLLSRTGAIAIESREMPEPPDEPVAVRTVSLPVPSDDIRLRHKTTDRAFYNQARAAAGTPEVVFVDREGFVTEGSFTNVFVERGDRLLTPPLSRGLLPGVLRRQLLDDGQAAEADLRPEDLERGFYIGNAVRGLVAAKLVE